jgi:ABC-type nitrate/sulfonate/bicarbonate transport system substrate-binding protein
MRGGIAEFHLGRFLDLNGMSIWDVNLINVPPPGWVESTQNGNVDAILALQPYVGQMKEKMPNALTIFPVQNNQLTNGLLVAKNDWISQNSETIRRFLKALTRAETYIVNNPEAAKIVIQKRLSYDDVTMAELWPQYRFSLSLDFSLIIAMNDEAHWMMNNSITTEKTSPDFYNYIYVDGLKAVKQKR